MRSFVEKIKNIEHLPPINFREKEIPFVAKGNGAQADIAAFGGSKDDYEFWQPHMCSTCCIKSIHDSVYPNEKLSLLDLAKRSVEMGVFEIGQGSVRGAFHYPMRDLLRSMNIPAQVYSRIDEASMIHALGSGTFVILSINLMKSRHITHSESHLVLIYNFTPEKNEFTVHDSANAITHSGNAAVISREYLENLSNHRGLIVG